MVGRVFSVPSSLPHARNSNFGMFTKTPARDNFCPARRRKLSLHGKFRGNSLKTYFSRKQFKFYTSNLIFLEFELPLAPFDMDSTALVFRGAECLGGF